MRSTVWKFSAGESTETISVKMESKTGNQEKVSCLGFRFTCRYIDILYIQLPYPSAENS